MNNQSQKSKTRNAVIAIVIGLAILISFLVKELRAPKADALILRSAKYAIPNGIDKLSTPRPIPTPDASPTGSSSPSVAAALGRPRVIISESEVESLRGLAKVGLSAVYLGEKAFRAEYGRYTTDLKGIGFGPDHAELGFKAGFLQEFDPQQLIQAGDFSETPNRMTTDIYIGESFGTNGDYYAYKPAVNSLDLSRFRSLCRSGCTASDDSFEVLIAVPLGDDQHVDVWRIDGQKELAQVQDGTKN